jgi:hypothetical protein
MAICAASKRGSERGRQADVTAQYPWATAFADCSDGPFPEAEPWYPGCWESERETKARIAGCKDWLQGLAQTLPEDDAVLLVRILSFRFPFAHISLTVCLFCLTLQLTFPPQVSHGDTIWKLFASLIGAFDSPF